MMVTIEQVAAIIDPEAFEDWTIIDPKDWDRIRRPKTLILNEEQRERWLRIRACAREDARVKAENILALFPPSTNGVDVPFDPMTIARAAFALASSVTGATEVLQKALWTFNNTRQTDDAS
jgi:hypothetical protein